MEGGNGVKFKCIDGGEDGVRDKGWTQKPEEYGGIGWDGAVSGDIDIDSISRTLTVTPPLAMKKNSTVVIIPEI